MGRKLEVLRERKLEALLPKKGRPRKLEASGVAVLDDETCLVIFDSVQGIARVALSLKKSKENVLVPTLAIGEGFEDVAIDHEARRVFCLIESLEDADGKYRGFIIEYDDHLCMMSCTPLDQMFGSPNKGFEGLAYLRHEGVEWLYAMCEGNLCTDAKKGGGVIQAYRRSQDGMWRHDHEVRLPLSAEFVDYAGVSFRGLRLAVVSQASSRLWVGTVNPEKRKLEGPGEIYEFPTNEYCNVEGVAWLTDDELVFVSDRRKQDKKRKDGSLRKKGQPKRCEAKDQSIHVMRLPAD